MSEAMPKWPKTLTIIRHGESEHNKALDVLQGDLKEKALEELSNVRDADIALTDLGRRQAEQTGKLLAQREPFDVCQVSPYKRTVQTAQGILSQLPYELKMHEDIRLREKEFGRLHGLSKEQIREKFPEEERFKKMEGKFYYRLLGGENYPDVADRVHNFMAKLTRKYAGKRVLIVTHQVPYKLFRFWFEHLGEKGVLDLPEAPNCGIQTYNSDFSKTPEGRLKLVEFNQTAYEPKK